MKNRPACDLHIHSRYSDGALDPAAIVRAAAGAGLSAVAVTDHDTVAGQSGALGAAGAASIEVLTGIELSIEEDGLDLHILGYCCDHRDETLLRRLSGLAQRRIERVAAMVDLLAKAGVAVTLDEVLEEAGEGTVGRPHVAKVLLRRGVTGAFQEAFARWIGYGGACYVPKVVLDLDEVVALIRG
ncbi:MAG: PHP domain-containing protein, partial [Candidatus Krumholzibacteria bacterium]|nr:PHP domain-containing protein [Candidatus Krumholzibacteria bacterium]